MEKGEKEIVVYLLMRDFIARVGRRRSEVEKILGPHREDKRNTEEEMLIGKGF